MKAAERLFVWLGGAVFVAALAFCAWSYLAVWGTGAPPGLFIVVAGRPATRGVALGANALLFGLFAAHHSLFAREGVKNALARALPTRLIRPLYVWTASLLLMVACAAWLPIGGELYDHGGWLRWAHAAVQLTGVWLTIRSVRFIDALELAGIRRPTVAPSLQITGPYRLVRHPIYLGWLLMTFGAAHMTADRLTFAAISTAYLVIAIPWEERSLARVFGGAYVEYRRHVRWRIVPYVY